MDLHTASESRAQNFPNPDHITSDHQVGSTRSSYFTIVHQEHAPAHDRRDFGYYG